MKTILIIFFLISLSLAQPLQEFRAVKLTNVDSDLLFDQKRIANGMDFLATHNINAVLMVVWNGNSADGTHTLYPSAIMDSIFSRPVHPSFIAKHDPLERVIIEAHRNGIEVYPWWELGFATSYSQNGGYILNQFPDWALKNKNGNLVVKNGFDWMSAINPGPQNLILSLAMEVTRNYDVDGIEFSDRIPAMPVQGGYDSTTVAIYKSEHNGQNPPVNYSDPDWMAWRAAKLTEWFQVVHDSVKNYDSNLIVSSSPSLHPWAYQEYLQNSPAWIDNGIADNIIPQLYRYNINDYISILDQSLGFHHPQPRDIFFAGILMNISTYVMSPEYLLQALAENRARNVNGEAYFFYEGLRKNNNLLADTLLSTYYAKPAQLHYRQGNIWRPKASIINENDSTAIKTGNWTVSTIAGFKPNVLLLNDSEYGKIEYYMFVPFNAWFDVYAYNVTGPLAAQNAPFTVYNDTDSVRVLIDQTNNLNAGWQKLSSVFLKKGFKKVVKLDNSNVPAGQIVAADAVMLMINRKLSADVIVSGIDKPREYEKLTTHSFYLKQNYPNPFNAVTNIDFFLPRARLVNLAVYDLTGKKVAEIIKDKRNAGYHNFQFDASGLSSGTYFYVLKAGKNYDARKLLLLK